MAAVLKGHPEKIPATLEGYEAAFGVGRSCARVDSKEIFVLEETQTRLAGVKELHEVTKTKLMPRAVITGCNTGDLSNPSSMKQSTSLMAALISDQDMHDSPKGDTIRMWPVEVIALDNTTGLYNFYVFEPAVTPSDPWAVLPASTPGHVTRVYRSKETRADHANFGEFKVFQRRRENGKAVTVEVQPIGGGNRCFNCHVNGGPLMNETRDPWTNWVSFKKTVHATTQLSGSTQVLVSEALPNVHPGRSSLANDLQPIMELAIQSYVFGTSTTNGWARSTLAGGLPGGIGKMLESVFCETELNYASANASMPLEVWIDPLAAQGSGLDSGPPSYGDKSVAFQFPIRSTRDKETENWLIDAGYLAPATFIAVRLLDDENDIFSDARCSVLPEISEGLDAATPAKKVDEHIRTILLGKLDSLTFRTTQPKRHAYIKALLTPGVGSEAAQAAYFEELLKRFAAADQSDAAVRTKVQLRKQRARALFHLPSNPLPVLEPR